MANANLRAVATAEGLENVASVISSGNLVFETDRDPADVETALEAAWPRELGFEAMTTLRSRAELEEIVEMDPFAGLTHGPKTYLLVTFSKYPLARIFWDESGPAVELVAVTEREIFTVNDTTLGAGLGGMNRLEDEIGKTITSRTWLTVERILRKMG